MCCEFPGFVVCLTRGLLAPRGAGGRDCVGLCPCAAHPLLLQTSPAQGGDTQWALPLIANPPLNSKHKFTIKTQGLGPLSSIFTIYFCPREGRGWEGMGKEAAAQIPLFWDAPEGSNTPPGAAELWGQAQHPKPSLGPQRPPQHKAMAGTAGSVALLFPQLQELKISQDRQRGEVLMELHPLTFSGIQEG